MLLLRSWRVVHPAFGYRGGLSHSWRGRQSKTGVIARRAARSTCATRSTRAVLGHHELVPSRGASPRPHLAGASSPCSPHRAARRGDAGCATPAPAARAPAVAAAVALRVGCDHSLVVRWESDLREPAVWDLPALSRVFGTTPEDLIDGARLVCGRAWSSRSHPSGPRRRLGRLLASARRSRSLGPWEVYEATGIRGSRLSAIERGADPSLAEVRSLVRLLDLGLTQILRAASLDIELDPHTVPGSTHGPTRTGPAPEPGLRLPDGHGPRGW
jgi:hypothetical protein